LEILARSGAGHFRARRLLYFPRRRGGPEWRQLSDLVAADAHGKLHFLINQEGRFHEGSITLPISDPAEIASLVPAWLENPGKLDLLAVTRSGQVRAFEKEGRPPTGWK